MSSGQRGKKPISALEAHERSISENPDYYAVSLFKGAGKFERRECATLELARIAAAELAVGATRAVGIYAVKDGRDLIVEVVEPSKGAPNGTLGSRTDTERQG